MQNSTIIEGCIKGNAQSQKMLYEHFLPYIYGICRRFKLADEDIKDIVQEIFIEVFLSLKKYDAKKGELKYWVKSIAIHKVLKELRKKQQHFVDVSTISQEQGDWDISIKNLEASYLVGLIRTLPDGYRTIFNLYVVDGYSHKEIGKMLGINEASSRSQLTRAKKMLQAKLTTIDQK